MAPLPRQVSFYSGQHFPYLYILVNLTIAPTSCSMQAFSVGLQGT